MLIHLNGMPGVGKLTVAQILAEKLPAHLLDNHLLINAARASGHPHQSNGYFDMLSRISEMVYEDLASNGQVKNLIMTNCLAPEYDGDVKRYQRIIALAEQRHEGFVPVLLTCDVEENVRRGTDPGRKFKQKLTNPETIRSLPSKYSMIHMPDHPYALAIDTTHLSPEQTAAKIQAHVEKLVTCHPGEGRDPSGRGPDPIF